MIKDIEVLLDKYWSWLRDNTHLRSVDDMVEITTPYLDRHNDCLQIYAMRENEGYLLTDDGYTLDDLELSSFNINTSRRQHLFKTTLNSFGIQFNDRTKALEVKASADNFAFRKHNLLQAILSVNDLFYTASSAATALFHDDVVSWLDLLDIRYSPSIKFSGKSGFDHQFNFVIPKSRVRPERIVEAISRPSKETANRMVFAWIDTRRSRPSETIAYAILNDTERKIPKNVFDAMRSYNIQPIQWSEREQARESLAA